MTNRKMTPQRVAAEYDAGVQFNTGINLYDTVQTNENFFIGKQWEGVRSNTNRANQQRRAQAQVVANQIKKNNAERVNKYSLGKGVAGAVAKGVNQAAQGVASTLAMAEDVLLSPFELLSGQKLGELSDTAPLNKLAQRIKNEGQETQKKYADNVAKGGKAAELLDKYGAATVAAVPQAVMAYLTAGASAGASTAGLGAQAAAEMTPSMAGTIRRGVTAMAKDPNYWTAFSQVVGQSYDEAMDDMAKTGTENNKARTKAALYAMGNGLFNAAVEVGGGIQKLPEELKHGANAWKAWVDSAVDEGKEEAVQGVIERALQNGVYHKGNKLASLSDGDAILNPRTAAEEFAGGAVVGGVLGGGQIGVNAMLNAMNGRGNGTETPDVDAGARQATSEGNFTPAQENAAEGTQGTSKGAVSANTNLFSRNILENFNHARTYFIDFAKKNFPTVVTNAETGRQIGISRKGLDKFLSGNIPYEKYASGFHIPELIENGHKVAEAGNYHPQTANSIPTFEYYDSPIKIDGEQYNAHIRVKNTNVGDKYYGHTISEVEDIKIEPPTRTTAEAVAPENTGGSTEAPSPASDGTSALSGDLDHVASGDASTDTAPRTNQTSLAADGGAGVQAPVSLDPTVTQGNSGVKGEDMQRGGNYAPENHIDNRTAESVAPRSVNAFSFDHPELRGYYVEAAEQIAGIADLSRQYGQQMGARERTANGYQRASNIYETPALRAAMNEGLSRSQIIDAADRLIKDHGQENVKAAKTLELILDDMLTNGYTNVAGEQVGPNAAYLAAKAQIDGAQPVQARQAEELPIWDMDVPDDLPGSIGAARAGYQAPDVEPVERTSRLAESAARYTQAEGDATARSREDYDALFRYRAQSEAESLAKADDLVYIERDGKRQFLKDADPAAYEELTQYLEYAPAWNAQMVDAAMQIKNELQGRSIAMEITEDEYTRWLDIMREHATETGRGTQAWAKYSREGNEGGQSSELSAWENLQKSDLSDADRAERFRSILMYDKSIEQAETPEAMRDIILNIAEERGTLNGITGRQSAMLRKAAESALGSMDFGQLKQFAYESSAALSTDAQSANMGQKLKTVQVLNMLSNPKTAAKNIAGNTTFYALDAMSMRGAAVLDMALSKLTGTRSVAFEKSAMSSESRAAIMKAIRMSAAEITLDVDMGASGRYEQTGNRTFKASGNIIDRVLSACERNMGYLLTTSDEAYKGAARSTQRGTQELIESGKIQNAPKGYAESQADALAKYRTFQNDSRTADAIRSVYDILNMLAGVGDSGRKTKRGHTIHSFGAGDIIAPFTRVAGNLASVGLDYSPVNAVKGTVEIVEAVADAARNGANPAKQAKAVSDFARGMTGTAIAYGFMQLAKMGLLKRADDEDDKDVAALNKSEGLTGAQINITAAKRWMDGDETGMWRDGDTLVDLSNLEPLNFMVSLGAEMADNGNDSFLSTFVATQSYTDTADSFVKAAADLPVMQTIGNLRKDILVYKKDWKEALPEAVGNTVISSITPNVLASIAKGIDDKQRNVYAGDGTKDVLIDTLKSRIPKVRETLPTTVNTLGEEKDNPGSLSKRLTNALINPIGVNKYTQSEVSQEMERVRGATGETGFYPTTRKPDSLSYKDVDGKEHTVVLDYDQKQAFQAACATGQMAYTAAMMKTSIYKAAGDTTKAELLDRYYKYSYEAAKAEVLGDEAVDKWVLHARNAKSELGMSTADYLANFEKYGSDVMSGTGFEKTKRMLDAGLSLDDWAKMRGSVDADKNGSVKKAELTGYIESHFPQDKWRELFDAYKGGQNWKNPY
ncbi:hypothetical protein [Oscillibacter sp. ER4]|uniref:LPD3 domain-containing protein n=1 Tax=Oscillibacter sp. ER4 TaxID=1519439 RepID=UPI00051AB301|nr:hypothetical protein [Oscillibacter sp. ER4]